MRKFTIYNLQFSIKFFVLLFTFYILHSTFYISPAYASADIGQSRIHPASPLYFLKSIREILELKFAGTTRVRAYRQLEFATRRIREVKSLAQTSRQDLIEPTLERYLSHLEELLGIADLKDIDFATEMSKDISLHMDVLQAVYSQVTDKKALMSIRAIINSLSKWDSRFIDRLKSAGRLPSAEQVSISRLSACNFLKKEASSSALNEVEQAVFALRAKECYSPVFEGRLR